jgi:ubiquinone/menaquinone biosynthesis C-methylase UbiE
MSEEIERIRREYEKRDASGYGRRYSYDNPAFMYHMQEREWGIMQALDRERFDLTNTNVLEVGCGTGHILQRFLEFGAQSATGIDLMPNRVQAGSRRYPSVRILQADASVLPFASESFGLVSQFMCLSSVLDSDLRYRIADEMWRVLSPGGLILSYDLRPSSLMNRAVNLLGSRFQAQSTKAGSQSITPIRPLPVGELMGLYSKGRIRILPISLNFHLAALAKVSRLLPSLLSTLPAFRSHFLAVIRKPIERDLDV